MPQAKLNKIIESQIKIFKPDVIFTHSSKDLNLDHQTIMENLFWLPEPTKIKNIVNEIYSFEILSSTEWNFVNSFDQIIYKVNKKKYIAKMEGS